MSLTLNMNGGTGKQVIAFIKVTYPVNSICTCSNSSGTKTLTAKDTSGSYVFSITDAGDWTVNSTDGLKSKSLLVTVTEWSVYNVSIAYRATYVDSGTVTTQFTLSVGNITSGDNYAQLSSGGNNYCIAYVPIDLSNYNTLTIVLAENGPTYSNNSIPAFGVTQEVPTLNSSGEIPQNIILEIEKFPLTSFTYITAGTYTIDLSSYSSEGYVFLTVSGASSLPNATGIMNIIDFYAE